MAVAVTFSVKKYFIRPDLISNAMERAAAKGLLKAASMVRRTARGSMRKKSSAARRRADKESTERKRRRGRPPATKSPAGSPPFCWSSEPNLRTILFARLPGEDSIIIGPVSLARGGKTPASAVHEHGRTTTISTGSRRNRKHVRARYPKRPFMGPALEKEKTKIAPLIAAAFRPV